MTDGGDALADIQEGKRFPFGANWADFVDRVDDERIEACKDALRHMLQRPQLEGCRFLDAGCGSGIHSLAARQLGATVVAFDYDPQSVACAARLLERFKEDPRLCQLLQGSVLDRTFLGSLGAFDIVYSWGVLHHTGSMWEAMAGVAECVGQDGVLFVAIYNDQGWISRYWKRVKVLYNTNIGWRWLMIAVHFPYLIVGRMISHMLKRMHGPGRGMSYWTDMKDWLGGLPFEVARPNEVIEFFRERGFVLERLKSCGTRPGCNEFVLRRT